MPRLPRARRPLPMRSWARAVRRTSRDDQLPNPRAAPRVPELPHPQRPPTHRLLPRTPTRHELRQVRSRPRRTPTLRRLSSRGGHQPTPHPRIRRTRRHRMAPHHTQPRMGTRHPLPTPRHTPPHHPLPPRMPTTTYPPHNRHPPYLPSLLPHSPPRQRMHCLLPPRMTTPGDPRTGRRWQALARMVIARDRGICWRCGRQGADTAGHILPASTHPALALDPDNLRAEHGTRRRLEVDGYECIGNYAAGKDAGQLSTGDNATIERERRRWLGG
jgi:5-methylcytosine-specific restriction endonuclease McrA